MSWVRARFCCCAHVGHMFLNRTHMALRGSMRPNVSDPLISRRRLTSAPAVSPPRPPDRDAFRGFSAGLWGDATEGFCLDGSGYEPAPGVFSLRFQFRQTYFQQADKPRTRTRRTELRAPRNKTKGGKKKSKPPARRDMTRCFLLCFLGFKL